MRSLMALGFGGILIVFAGLFFKPQFVIQNQKYHSFYVPLHQNLCTAFRGTFSPDSIACLAFFAN